MGARVKAHWGDRNGAFKDINMALLFDPNNPKLYIQRSQLLKYEFNLYNEAKNDLNSALNIENSNAPAYHERALINIELGLIDEACSDFKKAKELGCKSWSEQMKSCGFEYEDK